MANPLRHNDCRVDPDASLPRCCCARSGAPAARHAWVRITTFEAWPAYTPVARQPLGRAAGGRLAGGRRRGWRVGGRLAGGRLAGGRLAGGWRSAAPAARHAWVRITTSEARPAYMPAARQPLGRGAAMVVAGPAPVPVSRQPSLRRFTFVAARERRRRPSRPSRPSRPKRPSRPSRPSRPRRPSARVGGWLTGGVGGRRAAWAGGGRRAAWAGGGRACARLAGGEQAGWLARTADARLAGASSGGRAAGRRPPRRQRDTAWVRITAFEARPANMPVARQPPGAGRRWLSQGLLQYW
jgi:hypothetical protein